MSEQTTPSLLEQLQAHHQAGYLSLHMPGHKENAALAPYLAQLGAEWDITELPGFDDLHAPEGILAKMMDRAAALWGEYGMLPKDLFAQLGRLFAEHHR